MKEKYFFIITCLLFNVLAFSQDCTTQRTMSNDTSICLGQSTTISLQSSELGVFYQLRNGGLNVGLPVVGTGGLINFNVSPTTSSIYSVFVINCGITYNDTCTVTVNPIPDVTATNSTQTICTNSSITTIALSSSVAGTTFNWVRNNTINVTGIPISGNGDIAGILVNNTNNPQVVTFTITPSANGCIGNSITAIVTVNASTLGGNVTTTSPGVTPSSNIFTHCHVGNGTLYLNNQRGNVLRWEYSTDAGLNWTSISNTLNTHNYNGILTSTLFRAVVQNGSSCAIMYSTASMINVIPNIKPSPVTASPAIICNGDSSILNSESGYATSQYLASGGTFQNANPPGWLVDGCGNCLNAGMSNTLPGPWQLSATNGGTYSGTKYTSQGKFVIANGKYDSYLETPVFNTFGLTTAQLTFNHAFKLQSGANGYVQISVNGGPYNTLLHFAGPQNRTPTLNFHTSSVETIDLSSYIGQPNLRIRFYYQGTVGSSWAIDNIAIPDVPINIQTQWVDAVSGNVISNSQSLTVSPNVTTTYAITSFLNGCNSFGTDGTAYVTVTVNQRPTAAISQDQFVCIGGTATFDIDLTGTPPWSVTYNDGTTSTTVNNIMSTPYSFNVPNITTDKTYSISAVDDNNCTAIPSDYIGQAAVTVLDGTPGLWTGLVSNDWFDCLNWDGGLPTINIDAIIPAGSLNMPLIDPSTSPYAYLYGNMASARDLNINSGASLTMVTNSNLEINRNWINNGTFNPGQGNVNFIGSALNQIQTINQGIKLNETFHDLTLNSGANAKGISLPDGFELTVRNMLTLTNGTLRLMGEAQLIQNGLVANPISGDGVLLIDQEGKSSSYHYNYWSSPVSMNGTNYTINEILKSGSHSLTNPFTPGSISYGNGIYYADGAYSDPIKLSTRWMYKYSATTPDYFNWQHIQNTGTINIGEGYIMKGVTGTASISDLQNYTFVGKPNNGTINLTIGAGQDYLIGNPYPSALDANQFILDNIKDNGGNASTNIINGALYFWDHFGAQTHFLSQYIGGYATYTLMGGVVAVSNDPLINNNNATGSKVPKRYIPVAQGFFVKAHGDSALTTNNPNMTSPITGGTIQLKNSQRSFEKESGSNSIFFKNSNAVSSMNTVSDQRMKIRFGIETDNGFRRQILLGADSNTTSMFDIGFDAPMIDVQEDDFYWNLNSVPLIIQAIENFNVGQFIPVTVKLTNANSFTITIDELENIDTNTEIYLHDNITAVYYDLRNGAVTLNLGQGEYANRFSITFTNTILSEDEVIESLEDLLVYVNNSNNTLHINNNTTNTLISEVYLFDILGQLLNKWEVKEANQSNLEYNLSNLSDGTHIIKLVTNNGDLSSKIIID
ncbi:PKD-like domain-containing protein [Flavobacterium okayamense]|uniref:PKD-like domain-containing protein n=1 Tax=Flavobacterium okayamense TaxID=2830782 RepID=A0ABN6I1I3_9FLAO|nr:PKD-like domain-containing protein [Flavobacterium okayamense]BCY29695.1 hypothetical protein KK2020170_25630 [Flavobacterium okayamense]